MPVVTTIRSILNVKGSDTYGLPPEASVYQAIEMMAQRGVGALVVVQEGKLVGILSERDYSRKVILKGKSSKETTIAAIMSTPVTAVTPECTVDEAMSVMTERHFRHLPVMENDELVGVVSIGDLVKATIDDQAETIDQLHAYITGEYPR